MKKKLPRISILIFVVIVMLAFNSGCSQEKDKPEILSMVIFLQDIPPGNFFTHLFIDKVREISKGKLVIRLVGGPEAIPATDAPAAVQRGSVDMANAMVAFADTLAPGVDMLGRAEYSPEELRKRGVVKFVQDIFAKSGVYYLGASSPSKPQAQTAIYLKKEVKTIKDFKGLKIAASGGSQKAFLEGLGAVCVPIGFPDYFTAMERGTVDGYNIGIPGIQDFGLTPVTGYMLDELFSSCGSGWLINLEKWNGLSREFKDVLTRAAIETEIEGVVEWEKIVAGVKKDISAEGVKIIKFSHEDSIEFYRTYRDRMGKDDLERSPENGSKLQRLTLNPEFHRLK